MKILKGIKLNKDLLILDIEEEISRENPEEAIDAQDFSITDMHYQSNEGTKIAMGFAILGLNQF